MKFGVEILMMLEGVKSTFHDNRIRTDLAEATGRTTTTVRTKTSTARCIFHGKSMETIVNGTDLMTLGDGTVITFIGIDHKLF